MDIITCVCIKVAQWKKALRMLESAHRQKA